MAVPRFCVRLKPNNAAKKDKGKEAVGDMYAVSPDCVEGMRMWMSSVQGNSELDEDMVIPTPALTPRPMSFTAELTSWNFWVSS